MSRIANAPIELPEGVSVEIGSEAIIVQGPKGELSQEIHPSVEVREEEGALKFAPRDGSRKSVAFSGTMRSIIANMVQGVTEGFERRLEINGVGYRADVSGQKLTLQLGFSHPVEYEVPDNITVEVEQNTRVVVKGLEKEAVGQVAADIRSFRPPEPYKGKGVKLADERIIRKEAKKK
jgi:large subunit ribosomal protein L6